MKTELVYVVEDEKFFSSLTTNVLKEQGYVNVVQYYNGKDCLDNLYKNPSIIILDHMLNDVDGIDILRNIKSVNPNIEIIFLSGQEEMQVAVNALKYGAFDYVTKGELCFDKLKSSLTKLEEMKLLLQRRNKSSSLAERLLNGLGLL
jgi:DNA-binding NtrC family response regulator